LPYCGTHKEQLELIYSLSDEKLKVAPFSVEEIVKDVWDETHQIGRQEIIRYLDEVLTDGAV